MLWSICKKFILGIAILGLIGCQQGNSSNQIKVGTISGPETQLMEVAKQVAKQRFGLDIKIVEFNDYMLPNMALSDGSIDATACVTLPYLQDLMKAKQLKLIPVAKTFIYPIGVYSNKIKSLNDIASKGIVAISNDPSNGARGLLLLQKAGLITLKNGAGFSATIADIVKNDKNLTIKEIDAAQLPRALPDVDAAVINTNFVVAAGLNPKDAIYREGSDSPYYNLIVTRENNKNAPSVIKLISAYQSPEVIAEAKKLFNDDAIPAW